MEDDIAKAKEARSRLKARITTLSSQLSRPTLTNGDREKYYKELRDQHDEFLIVHSSFCSLVEDDKYSDYRVVSGLECDAYLAAVSDTYDRAVSIYVESTLKVLTDSTQSALRKAENILTQSNSDDYSLGDIVGTQARNHREFCKQLYDSIFNYDSGNTVLCHLDEIISKLELFEMKCDRAHKPSNVHISADQAQPDLQISNDNHSSSNHVSQSRQYLPVPGGRVSFGPGLESTRMGVEPSLGPQHSPGLAVAGSTDTSIVSIYHNRSVSTQPLQENTSQAGEVECRVPTYRYKFERTPLPTFNGDRKAWPEFRSVWRMYAHSEFSSDKERAWALKRCLKGEALDCVGALYSHHDEVYNIMLQRLDNKYSDVSLSIQAVCADFDKFSPVKDEDANGIIKFINKVELAYSQLGEVDQINCISLVQVDRLSELLPVTLKRDWRKVFRSASEYNKRHPFSMFMSFLDGEREMAMRYPSKNPEKMSFKKVSTNAASSTEGQLTVYPPNMHVCLIHSQSESIHNTEDCKKFKSLSVSEKYNVLKEKHACFQCLGKHPRRKCSSKLKCVTCQRTNHHSLLCKIAEAKSKSQSHITAVNEQLEIVDTVSSSSYMCRNSQSVGALLPIQLIKTANRSAWVNVFFDSGSNASFITKTAAKRIGARMIAPMNLGVTTTGNVVKQIPTHLYEVCLLDSAGSIVRVSAYGLKDITGKVSSPDSQVLQNLFPGVELSGLRRGSTVDILIGSELSGLHPRKVIASAGPHLSILEGPFGRCMQGSHPELGSASFQAHFCEVSQLNNESDVHCYYFRSDKVDTFITGEDLGTEISIKCGGCKCNKCPSPGHTYSFREEQELEMIRSNLQYDEKRKHWVTSYPWIVEPHTLPNNYTSALATLKSTERTLKKDTSWSSVYNKQIEDMVERGVARKLSRSEDLAWDGPVFYISHLAVRNPKSRSTPVRIVFNSSQTFKGISLNSCLAKGPDAYLNSIPGILLRWREGQIALVGDIKKMYNSIFVKDIEQHSHRFLWRNLEERDPDTYIICRVNMGDKPASAISTEAIYKTADLFRSQFPQVCSLLRHSTYVDDIVDSFSSLAKAIQISVETTHVLGQAGFRIKHWLCSGESSPRACLSQKPETADKELQVESVTVVLGVPWESKSDKLVFTPKLNFSKKNKGVYKDSDLTVDQVPGSIPLKLTRRSVLEQTMKVYDPLGMFSPFTLQAKKLLRETWTQKLGWDDELSEDLQVRWSKFFCDLFVLQSFQYDRCLKPEGVVGNPQLIILSDASDVAFGFSAYVRWLLEDGSFWCRLIMSKSRIAPVRKVATPQLELNAAVLSARGRKLIEKEMRYEFSSVHQLIDSETVLCMINKVSTRFKLYEGVRVGEIQSSTDGNMSCWSWVKGEENTADWLTRCKDPGQLGPDSEWWNGPSFLYKPEESWGIKSYSQCRGTVCSHMTGVLVNVTDTEVTGPFLEYERFSGARKVVWTVARVLSSLKRKSFCGISDSRIGPDLLSEAQCCILKDVQREMLVDLEKGKGRYAKLVPVRDGRGLWCVGKRLVRGNPMTVAGDDLQVLLPNDHWYAELLLRQAHIDGGHRGRDATLARFRQSYWITQGTKVAQRVVSACQLCCLREAKFVTQEMGLLPTERLKVGPPFNTVMVDLFGPYLVRGEVQRRTSGKAYGVLFTDLCSRAVHIEVAFGYDTASFMMALCRFCSVRGWPSVIYSDRGTQLIGAEKELVSMWDAMDREQVYRVSTDNGTSWKFSPADSPWHQGAVEALVKAVKRSIKMSVSNQRLSPSEFNTLCAEVGNILNERPLGVLPGSDAEINILTPNSQLIGRPFARNPGSWSTDSKLGSRLRLIDSIANHFWAKWSELYAPSLVRQTKWTRRSSNLQPGDVVIVADSNSIRGQYRLARVHKVDPGADGVVRKVAVIYKNYKVGEKVYRYTGGRDVIVLRSVQRLALIVPVDGCSSTVGGSGVHVRSGSGGSCSD